MPSIVRIDGVDFVRVRPLGLAIERSGMAAPRKQAAEVPAHATHLAGLRLRRGGMRHSYLGCVMVES